MKQLCKIHLLSQILFSVITLGSCHSQSSHTTPPNEAISLKSYRIRKLILPSGRLIEAYSAESDQQQERGLSGVKELAKYRGMVFIYKQATPLRFWMPDTYLNLDIFFMDSSLNIVHIERNIAAHPGRQEPPAIARTATIYSQIVLELEHGSEASKSIKKGDQLKWLVNPKIK
jgi:uncharacterized membrane protein (UPF0127 family)